MDSLFQYDVAEKNIGVASLKNLKASWELNKVPVPVKDGSGSHADEIDEMVISYEELYQSFLLLIDNTISYIDLVGEELKTLDEIMAISICERTVL